MPHCVGCTCTIDIDMDTYSGYDGGIYCNVCPTPPQHETAKTIQWIGEAAAQAQAAYEAGDYDTLKACLETIQQYAQDLGYEPAATSQEGDK